MKEDSTINLWAPPTYALIHVYEHALPCEKWHLQLESHNKETKQSYQKWGKKARISRDDLETATEKCKSKP